METREKMAIASQLKAWEPFAFAGSVKATWHQYGTPHGRYSCEDPNLQSRVLPIRETIEPEPDWLFTSCDLGQAEYVTWASLSGDTTLGRSFAEKKDFHRTMYEEIHAAAPEVDLYEADPRQAGKTINFALLYLMQPFTLAKRLGLTTAEAQRLIEAYQARAPQATTYIQRVIEAAKESGQITTKFGRSRAMPDLKKARGARLHELSKTAWHHHNAGTAAELLKIKQAKVWNALQREKLSPDRAKLIVNFHDEIICTARKDVVREVEAIMLEKFNEPTPGFLPFRVDQRTGANWLEISK
jgi:DNA polymerase-1